MKLKIICALLIFGSASAMEAPQPQRDANGYRYRDENAVQDKRKIAILSYGSLVRQNTNNQSGAKLEASAFSPTNIQLPVSISRQSQGNRMTAVIDKNGDLKRVWAATSQFQFLPNARNNLAAREGSPYRGQDIGYDLTNIFYMKKLLPDRMKDANEELVPNTDRWVIRTEANERQRIPAATAQALAQWADANGYAAITWASFPPNLSSQQAAAAKLIENAELLRNTQEYVRNLPDGAQSVFERAIIDGPDALRALVAMPTQPTIQLTPVSRPGPARPIAGTPPQAVPVRLTPVSRPAPAAPAARPQSIDERIQNVINKINAAKPNLFKNISPELQNRIVTFLEGMPDGAFYRLAEVYSPTNGAFLGGLAQLFKAPLYAKAKPARTDPSKYTGYNLFMVNEDEFKRTRNSDEISLKKYLKLNANPNSSQKANDLLRTLTDQYKIHLMPVVTDNTDVNISYLLFDAMEKDPELKSLIMAFKVAVSDPMKDPNMRNAEGIPNPYLVIYVKDGKDAAQKALNKLYFLFKNHSEFKGTGQRPRFNTKVNDLIWVAQGDGDDKTDANTPYFDQSRIYYSSTITGRQENYHLKHPETGKELID